MRSDIVGDSRKVGFEMPGDMGWHRCLPNSKSAVNIIEASASTSTLSRLQLCRRYAALKSAGSSAQGLPPLPLNHMIYVRIHTYCTYRYLGSLSIWLRAATPLDP